MLEHIIIFIRSVSAFFLLLLVTRILGKQTILHVALKSRKLRKWISGAPTVLIEAGKVLEENMKKNKYTLDSLNEMLREKDIFDIEEVDYALLESNGKLSVMK